MIMIFIVAEIKKVYVTKVTLYDTFEIKFSISVMINEFFLITKHRKYQKRV